MAPPPKYDTNAVHMACGAICPAISAHGRGAIRRLRWLVRKQANRENILAANYHGCNFETKYTPDDEKLRSALTNKHFASCSKEDLQFLQRRTIGSQPGKPTFDCREL
jgi:hypothetical protein